MADNSNDDGGVAVHSSGRVPMPPPLSKLDPFSDLGFRSTTRTGLASPSAVWGDFLNTYDASEEAGSINDESGDKGRKMKDNQTRFTPLPTNEWYMVSAHYHFTHNRLKRMTLIHRVSYWLFGFFFVVFFESIVKPFLNQITTESRNNS